MNINIHQPPEYSSVPQDNLILEHYGINELNFESIKRYREKFSANKPDHPWNGLEIKEFLYKIGAWGKVRNTNKEGLTLAGLLMFSEERVITEVLPQYFIEYRETLDSTTDEAWSKRFTSQDGTWSGNVFDFYVKTSTDLVENFDSLYKRQNSTHTDETAIVSCLHESLINALVHADYYGEGGIVMEKERALFRFSNPGLLRISVEQALEGNISNLRNPNLFKMFILIGLCKRTGSGLKGIETAWKYYGPDAFDLAQDSESERTILTLHVNLNVTEEDELIEEITESDLFLSPEEESNESLMANFDDSESSYNNELSSYNSESNSMNKEESSCNKRGNSFNKGNNSYNNAYNSSNSGSNSYNSDGNSYNKEELPFEHLDSMLNSYNSEILVTNEENIDLAVNDSTNETTKEEVVNSPSPEEVERKLWEISELARRKKRLSPNIMEEIITELCTQKPLMIRELADLVGRTPDGLRNNYLAKLLAKGKVKLKYPEQINHPKQAYIAVKRQQK